MRGGRDSDLWLLDRELRARHPDPFHDVDETTWHAAVEAAARRAIDDEAVLIEVLRLLALLGPRDGHTTLWPLARGHRRSLRHLPLRVFLFQEGVYVVAGAYVGERVVAIGGVDVGEVTGRLAQLVPADNAHSRAARLPEWLTCVELLCGVGIVGDAARVELELESGTVTLEPVDAASVPALPPPPVPTDNAYVAYASTDASTAARVATDLARLRGRRAVLDIRMNGGGDNTTYGAVLDAVAAHGDVVVLVGRGTFSAAANFAAVVATVPCVSLVGEPTGGAPNQWGDAEDVVLPESGWRVRIATLYHEPIPGSTAAATEPDLLVPVRAEDWLAGRDAALAAAVDFPSRN